MARLRTYILIFLALLCAMLLFVGGPGAETLRSVRSLWGVGHVVCFALWAYLYSLWCGHKSFGQLLFEVLLLALLFGIVTEAIQDQVGRDASMADLSSDLLGALVGFGFFCWERRKVNGWSLRACQFAIAAVLVWVLNPVGQTLLDDIVAWWQFPLLSGFETPLEISRWGGSAARSVTGDVAFDGRASLKIKFSTQRYSGIGLRDFPHDWQAYEKLKLYVFSSDQDDFKLHLRIHDRQHNQDYSDRYNHTFIIGQGWNELEVSLGDVEQSPRGRSLDLSEIAGLGLFVGKLDVSRTVFVDNVVLIPPEK